MMKSKIMTTVLLGLLQFTCFAQKIEPLTPKIVKKAYNVFLKLEDDRFYGVELEFNSNKQSNLPCPTLQVAIYENGEKTLYREKWLDCYLYLDDKASLRYNKYINDVEINCPRGKFRTGKNQEKKYVRKLSLYRNVHSGCAIDIAIDDLKSEEILHLDIKSMSVFRNMVRYVQDDAETMQEFIRLFMVKGWERMY